MPGFFRALECVAPCCKTAPDNHFLLLPTASCKEEVVKQWQGASHNHTNHVISLTRTFRGPQGTLLLSSFFIPPPLFSFDIVLPCTPGTCDPSPLPPILSMRHKHAPQAQQEHYWNKTVTLGKGLTHLQQNFYLSTWSMPWFLFIFLCRPLFLHTLQTS